MVYARYADEGQAMKCHSCPIASAFTDEEVTSDPSAIQVVQSAGDHLAGSVLIEEKARLAMQGEAYLMLTILLPIRRAVTAHPDATDLAPTIRVGIDVLVGKAFGSQPAVMYLHVLCQVEQAELIPRLDCAPGPRLRVQIGHLEPWIAHSKGRFP